MAPVLNGYNGAAATPAAGATATLTATITPAAGDVLVVKVVAGDSTVTLGVPTLARDGGGTAPILTSRHNITTANYCPIRLLTGRASEAVALTVSVTVTNTSPSTKYVAVLFESWSAATLASTPAINTTTTGTTATAFNGPVVAAAADSAITWVAGDWVPVTTGTPAYRSSAVLLEAVRNAQLNLWSAVQPVSAAGSQPVGMTAPTGQKWSLAAVELLPLTARTLAVGQPAEADTARPLAGRGRARAIGQVVDASLAVATGRARSRPVTAAGETDVVGRLRQPGDITPGFEADEAAPLARLRRLTLNLAPEADTARPLAGRSRVRAIGQAIDTATGWALAGRAHTRGVGRAADTALARPHGRSHRRDIGRAGEFDTVAQRPESALGQVSDADFAVAIAAPERRPLAVFRVDWDSSGYAGGDEDLSDNLTSIEVERSLDGDLPAGAGLIDGYATATVKAELGGTRPGASMPLSAELSPFRPDSPFYGQRKSLRPALVELGFVTEQGVRLERMHTGPLRAFAVGEGSGEVTMDGVDPSELIRALVTLPTYGEFVTHASRREWKLTVNSQAIVDLCLRYNGIFASPPPHPQAIISCTGHGALFAEVGFNGAPISIYGSGPAAGLWTEDNHPYRMLGTPESPTGGTVGYQEFYGRSADRINPPVRFQAGNGVGLSCLLHAGDYMSFGASVENRLFQVRITEREYPRLFVNVMGDGKVYAGLTTGASSIFATPKISTGPDRWKFFGVHFRWTSNTTLVVTFRLNGSTTSYTLTVPAITITPTPFFAGYRPILQVNGHMSRAWSNLSVWPSPTAPPAGPWWGESHVPMADIGRGHNELTYLPDVPAQDSWEVLKAVTQAEYAVHGFTEYGRYYWRPRTDVRPDRIDHLLDVDTNLADVAYSYGSDTIRNSIGLALAPKFHSGQVKTVVETKDVDQARVPGSSIRIFELDWPHGAAGVQSGILPYCYQSGAATEARDAAAGFPKWPQPHGWTYSSIGASGGFTILDNTRSVVVSFVQVDARRVQIRVTNPGPGPIRLATAADPADLEGKPGEPAMHIGGWPLEAATTRVVTYRNEASIAELGGQYGGGERSLPIEATEWRQHEPALAPVAYALLDALADENPILEDLEVRGDPRIKVGNVAAGKFRAPEVVVVGTVVKTRHVLNETGYRTLVSLRPLPARTLAPERFEFYVDISHFQADSNSPLDLGRLKVLGYSGCVAKIGQGAGTTATGTVYGATLDTAWEQWRDTSLALWPAATAGYWYVGNTEAPADQAARCLASIGDVGIPVMLDWEAGGGDFANLLACLDAFRAAGLLVTMVYTSRNYAATNAPAGSSLAGRGLSLISSRYWVNSAGDPRELWDDQPVGFGFEPFLGVTPAANQFTQFGRVYPGQEIDVDAFKGTPMQLSSMFHGEPY